MNEELNLVEILKNAPEGTEFWSDVHGVVKFNKIQNILGSEILCDTQKSISSFSEKGEFYSGYGSCVLFPSKTQRDWSKFKADLKEGTIVMCSDDGICFGLRYYKGNKRCYEAGRKKGDNISWRYIVPVSDFDFENIESNINKSI